MTDYQQQQIAEIRQDVRALKSERVSYRVVSVTAVHPLTSTFDADVPGAGLIEGISSPPQFLPAVGDSVRLSLSGATPVYLPHRIGEGAVGYDELNDGVIGDIDGAKADSATALATADGKNTATWSEDSPLELSPTPPGTDGDVWYRVDIYGLGRVTEMFVYEGGGWQQRYLHDTVLSSLTVGKLTSGQIAAGVAITIGDPTTDHTVIDDEKIAFEAVGPDGSPVEISRFGRQSGGTDPLTGQQTWSVSENGEAAFESLSVDTDPIIMGDRLTDLLAPLASFHAGASRGSITDPALTPSTGGEVGFYEFTVELDANHLYLLQSSNFWVRPVTTGTSRIDVNLRYTVSTTPGVDPPPVTIASPLFTRWVQQVPSTGTIGHGVCLSRLVRYPKYAHFRFLISVASYDGAAYIEMGSGNQTDPDLDSVIEPDSVSFAVVDLGLNTWTNRAVTNSGGGGSTAPAPVKRYTYTYAPLWTRRFRGDNTIHTDGGDAVQGYTSYYPANGDQKTQIGDFRRSGNIGLVADLQGVTIEKFEVYLYASHWNYNSGGTAIIRYHNNVAPTGYTNVAGEVRVGGWARGQGRWVNVTSWGNIFRDGGAKGIVVGPSGTTDGLYYGVFDGHTGAHPPQIRVTYTK